MSALWLAPSGLVAHGRVSIDLARLVCSAGLTCREQHSMRWGMALVTSSTAGISGRHSASLVVRHILLNLWKSLNWAWLDTVCQYRRSRIGPLWETINVVVMLLGLSLVSSAIFGSNLRDIIGYVAIGIIVWSAIASLISEGTMSFVRNTGY